MVIGESLDRDGGPGSFLMKEARAHSKVEGCNLLKYWPTIKDATRSPDLIWLFLGLEVSER